MLEHSPYSGVWPAALGDFELKVSLDECPFLICPERGKDRASVRWEYCLCGESEVRAAHLGWTAESLIIHGKFNAVRHMAHSHPGPATQAFLKDI